MVQVDNTKGFLGGKFAEINVKVPANTEYKKYLVLGINSEGNAVPYELSPQKAEGETAAPEKVAPAYILTRDLKNTSESAVTYYNVRVFIFGTVNKKCLIFKNAEDKNNAKTFAELKTNGFDVIPVQELT